MLTSFGIRSSDRKNAYHGYLYPQRSTERWDSMESHKNDHYSVKISYWFLCPKSVDLNQDQHLYIFLKWKHFIWKIMQNTLYTADNLRKRNVNVSPMCVLCLTNMETKTHLLKVCSISQRIWNISMGIRMDSCLNILIQDWLRNFLNLFWEKKEEEKISLRRSFISTL